MTDQKNTDLPELPETCTLACDVETMARRLCLDKRRVQQLAREGKLHKENF